MMPYSFSLATKSIPNTQAANKVNLINCQSYAPSNPSIIQLISNDANDITSISNIIITNKIIKPNKAPPNTTSKNLSITFNLSLTYHKDNINSDTLNKKNRRTYILRFPYMSRTEICITNYRDDI